MIVEEGEKTMNCDVSSLNSLEARLMGLLLLFLTFGLHADAQSTYGAFHGTVTDTTAAVIPGAKVEIKNLSTDQIRQAVTSDSGFYTITQLPPGHYSVSVSKESFATTTQPDVQLLVNQDLEANYTLQVGAVTQRVEVLSAPTMLKTAGATLGQEVG